jgi:hypothetical protein
MNSQSNSRILGAFLIGFAIVASAYMANSFKSPVVSNTPENISANVLDAPLRVAIPVKDSNDDGVEDWREEFVKTVPVITLANIDENYTPSDNLTDQASLKLIERVVSAKARGTLEETQDIIVSETVETLSSQTDDKIYSVRDIIILEDTSDTAIYTYGNAAATAILSNNVSDLRNELLIVRDMLNGTEVKEEDIEELRLRAQVFKNTRDATLNVPVPKSLTKEHLDLINVYNALYQDISSMVEITEDPLKALIRLKRYDEDTSGMLLALGNIYHALESGSVAFKEGDPAVFFVVFSPNYNKQ